MPEGNCREANIALLGKLVWDLHSNSKKLWVSLLSNKYVQDGIFLFNNSVMGSYVWNSISKAKAEVRDGYKLQLGNGKSSLWHSPWLDVGPLGHHVLFIHIHDSQLTFQV